MLQSKCIISKRNIGKNYVISIFFLQFSFLCRLLFLCLLRFLFFMLVMSVVLVYSVQTVDNSLVKSTDYSSNVLGFNSQCPQSVTKIVCDFNSRGVQHPLLTSLDSLTCGILVNIQAKHACLRNLTKDFFFSCKYLILFFSYLICTVLVSGGTFRTNRALLNCER